MDFLLGRNIWGRIAAKGTDLGITLNPVDALTGSVDRITQAGSTIYDVGGQIVDTSTKAFVQNTPVAPGILSDTPGVRNKINEFLPASQTIATPAPGPVPASYHAPAMPTMLPVYAAAAAGMFLLLFKSKKRKGRK